MRQKMRTGIVVAVLAVFALVGLGCQPPNLPIPMDQVRVPRGFDYSMTQDVKVKVTVADAEGTVGRGDVVTLGRGGEELVSGNILAQGITNVQGQFNALVRVPAGLSAFRVQANSGDARYDTEISIEGAAVGVSFGPEN